MSTNPNPITGLPTSGGTVTGNLTVNGSVTAGSSPGGPFPELVSTAGIAGVALINGTQNILTWTSPNDGQQHRFQLLAERNVTVSETGGQMTLTSTLPGGTVFANVVAAGGSGVSIATLNQIGTVAPNTTVTLAQTSALTAGACQVYGELWAS